MCVTIKFFLKLQLGRKNWQICLIYSAGVSEKTQMSQSWLRLIGLESVRQIVCQLIFPLAVQMGSQDNTNKYETNGVTFIIKSMCDFMSNNNTYSTIVQGSAMETKLKKQNRQQNKMDNITKWVLFKEVVV